MYDKDASKCGMSPVSESYYKRYRDVVRKLVSQKLDEDEVYENFTEGAYRVILAIKNDDAKTDAVSYVSECLHNGEKVTDRDLRGWFKVWKIENGVEDTKELTNVNSATPDTDVVPTTLAAQQAAKEVHVNPGPDVTCSPVIINDTYRESPFKTAAEIMAHDKDPMEVGKMFQRASIKDLQTVQPKTEKEMFRDACREAYDHGKPDFRQAIDDLMRYHPSWKDPGTVIYFCVTDPKEAIGGRK